MKKNLLVGMLLVFGLFFIISCTNTIKEVTCEAGYLSDGESCYLDVESSCEPYEVFDEVENVCVDTRTYIDLLSENPLNVSFNEHYVFEAYNGILLDYSFDQRVLWDISDFKDTDIIHFPDPAFESAIKEYLEFDETYQLTYADLKDVIYLGLSDSDIRSIEGIEIFSNLEVLNLNNNIKLTSVKGVETLQKLKSLYLEKTSVKFIDYKMGSLQNLNIAYTLVEVSSFEEFTQILYNYKSLIYADIRGLDITIYDLSNVNKAFHDFYTEESRRLKITVSQLDLSRISITQLYDIDEDFAFNKYPRATKLDIDYLSYEPTKYNYEDSYYFYGLYKQIEEHKSNIGIDESMDDVTKLFYIYNYLFDYCLNERYVTEYFEAETPTENQINLVNSTINRVEFLYELLLDEYSIRNYDENIYGIYGNIETKEVSFKVEEEKKTVVLDDNLGYIADIKTSLRNYIFENNSDRYYEFLIGSLSLKNRYQHYIDNSTIPAEYEYLYWNIKNDLNEYNYNIDVLISNLNQNTIINDLSSLETIKLYLHLNDDVEVITYKNKDVNALTLDYSYLNYEVLAWYLDENKTSLLSDFSTLIEETHLYAETIKRDYTVSFNTNNNETFDQINVKHSEYIELPIPTYEGYVFIGWSYNDQIIKSDIYQFLIDKDITLEANWVAFDDIFNYEITETDEIRLTEYLRDDYFISLPNEYNEKPITEISAYLFSGKSIGYIRLSENLKIIGEYAFNNTPNLKYLIIPQSIHMIEERAFLSSNADIIINHLIDTTNFIENWDYGSTIIYASSSLLTYQHMRYIVDANNNVILYDLLGTDQLTSLDIPNEINGLPVKIIWEYFAYGNRYITEVSIPTNVELLKIYCFANIGTLKDFTFDEGSNINTIESYVFSSSSLETIIIPESIDEMHSFIFSNSSPLVYFEGSINDLSNIYDHWYDWIFYASEYIYISKYLDNYQETIVQDGIIYTLRNNQTAYVTGVLEGHQTVLEIPDDVNGYSVIGIFDEAFMNNTILRKIILPATIQFIGESAFNHATALTEIVFPDDSALERIYPYAFANTKNLFTIENLPSIESIERYTFYNSNIFVLNLPEGLLNIGNHAFSDCENLNAIYLPISIIEINIDAFSFWSKYDTLFVTGLDEFNSVYTNAGLHEENMRYSIDYIDFDHEYIYGVYNDEVILLRLHLDQYTIYDQLDNHDIPEEIDGMVVNGLGDYLYQDYHIDYLTISSEIEFISEYAFYESDIYEIVLEYEIPDYYSEDWNYNGNEYIDYSETIY